METYRDARQTGDILIKDKGGSVYITGWTTWERLDEWFERLRLAIEHRNRLRSTYVWTVPDGADQV